MIDRKIDKYVHIDIHYTIRPDIHENTLLSPVNKGRFTQRKRDEKRERESTS